jgi:hypothetical protein
MSLLAPSAVKTNIRVLPEVQGKYLAAMTRPYHASEEPIRDMDGLTPGLVSEGDANRSLVSVFSCLLLVVLHSKSPCYPSHQVHVPYEQN